MRDIMSVVSNYPNLDSNHNPHHKLNNINISRKIFKNLVLLLNYGNITVVMRSVNRCDTVSHNQDTLPGTLPVHSLVRGSILQLRYQVPSVFHL